MADTSEGGTAHSAKAVLKKALWVAAFVVAFVVVKEAKQWWFESKAIEEAGRSGNQAIDDLRAKAAADHPEKPLAYAAQEEAKRRSTQELSKKAGADKADAAAGQFLGFYLVNVRTRREYCNAIGVDISPFTNAFVAAHADLYAKSRVIHARSPYSPDKIEQTLYQQLAPSLQKTISEAMTTMAKEGGATEKDVCNVFRTNGAAVAAEMHLSKVSPDLYRAMVEAH